MLNRLTYVIALLFGVLLAQAQVGTAVRELPYDFHPGDLINVRIQVTPPPGTTNWTVREWYPERWDFVGSTNASSTNEFTAELFFGPFVSDAARTLSYDVASAPVLTNAGAFHGEFVFNGATNTVAGTTNLPSRNEWMFDGPLVLEQGVSGVSHGAGRWVARDVGWTTTIESGGRVTYPRLIHIGGQCNSRLGYVGGLFLSFGSVEMKISDDGLSWKPAQREAGDSHVNPFEAQTVDMQSVAYGNGTYVAVGIHRYEGEYEHGAIFRSTNGYNWRRIFVLPYNSANPNPGVHQRFLYAVAFANNRFMAVAGRGTLVTSTNGSDWTEIQPIPVIGDPNISTTNSMWMNAHLRGIGYGPAGWIIPTSLLGTLLRSTDGDSWTVLSNVVGWAGGGNNEDRQAFWEAFYSDGKYWFTRCGAAGTTVDGMTWEYLTSANHPAGTVARAPDGVNPKYLGAGGVGALDGTLVSSTNGTNWSLETLSTTVWGTEWPRFLSVANFNGDIIVTGQASYSSGPHTAPTDRYPAIWVPGFGTPAMAIQSGAGTWRGAPMLYANYADLLVTTSGLLAAGRDNSVHLRADMLVGTNCSVVASANLPFLERQTPVVGWKNNLPQYPMGGYLNASFARSPSGYDLVAEGYHSAGPGPKMFWGHFTSPDGTNWSRRTAGLNDATNFPGIRGLAWGAGRFVAVSEGSSPAVPAYLTTTNRIFTSTDGETYTAVDLSGLAPGLGGEGLTGLAFANGRFIAIGNGGCILSSTNGLDWITVRNSDGHGWNRVRYLDGMWAVVGNAGWVGFSSDGQNWTSKTAGTESDLTDIAARNGTYTVVGSHGTVLVSLPVAPPIIVSSSLTRLPGQGLQFDVSGQAGKVLDIQTSSNLTDWTSLVLKTNLTGTVVVTDSEPARAKRFYRAVQQP